MTNSDLTTSGWLGCTCDVCKQLDAIAHDLPAWNALYNQTAAQCPQYARMRAVQPDDRQLTIEET